jgi:hypothetical protein
MQENTLNWSPAYERSSHVEKSAGRRLAEAAAFVALWALLGSALRLDANAYLVLGVPLGIAFQRFVARAPLRAAWVADAPPLAWNLRTVSLAAALAIAPASAIVQAVQVHSWAVGAWAVSGIAGAFGAAYAIRSAPRGRLGRLLLGGAFAAVPGILLFILFHLAQRAVTHALLSRGLATFVAIVSFAQYVPISFALEEVVFRGVLGAHVLRATSGWREAFLPSAVLSGLWGLWHLPIVHAAPGLSALASTAAVLVGVHVLCGLSFTWGWKWSGTLLVPAVAHALADAVRNGLM